MITDENPPYIAVTMGIGCWQAVLMSWKDGEYSIKKVLGTWKSKEKATVAASTYAAYWGLEVR